MIEIAILLTLIVSAFTSILVKSFYVRFVVGTLLTAIFTGIVMSNYMGNVHDEFFRWAVVEIVLTSAVTNLTVYCLLKLIAIKRKSTPET